MTAVENGNLILKLGTSCRPGSTFKFMPPICPQRTVVLNYGTKTASQLISAQI